MFFKKIFTGLIILIFVSTVCAEWISELTVLDIVDKKGFDSDNSRFSHRFSNPNYEHIVFFQSSSMGANVPVALVKGEYLVTQSPQSLRYGGERGWGFIPKKHSNAVFGNNFVLYPNQFGEGIDLKYSYTKNGLKELLIINSRDKLPTLSSDDVLIFRNIVRGFNKTVHDDNPGLSAKISGKKLVKGLNNNAGGKFSLVDNLDNDLWIMGGLVAYDSSQEVGTGLPVKIKLDYEVEITEDGKYVIDLVIPSSFLENAVYPVYIDPTWTTPNSDIVLTDEDGKDHGGKTIDDNTGTWWSEYSNVQSDLTDYDWGIRYDLGSLKLVDKVRFNACWGHSTWKDRCACKVGVLKVCDDSVCSGESNLLSNECMLAVDGSTWTTCDFNDVVGRYIEVRGGVCIDGTCSNCVSKSSSVEMARLNEFDAYISDLLNNGDSCNSNIQCFSGNCVDGVCCNNACDSTCVACDISGSVGTCTFIPSGSDPDNECGSVECDGDAVTPYYDGWSINTCYYKSDVADSSCNGAGQCLDATDYCPFQPGGDATDIICDCQAAETGCSGTTIGTCNNGVCSTSTTTTSTSTTTTTLSGTAVLSTYGGGLDIRPDSGAINLISGGDLDNYIRFETISDIPYIGAIGGEDIYFADGLGNWNTLHADSFTEHTNAYEGDSKTAREDLFIWSKAGHPTRFKPKDNSDGTDLGKAGKALAKLVLTNSERLDILDTLVEKPSPSRDQTDVKSLKESFTELKALNKALTERVEALEALVNELMAGSVETPECLSDNDCPDTKREYHCVGGDVYRLKSSFTCEDSRCVEDVSDDVYDECMEPDTCVEGEKYCVKPKTSSTIYVELSLPPSTTSTTIHVDDGNIKDTETPTTATQY